MVFRGFCIIYDRFSRFYTYFFPRFGRIGAVFPISGSRLSLHPFNFPNLGKTGRIFSNPWKPTALVASNFFKVWKKGVSGVGGFPTLGNVPTRFSKGWKKREPLEKRCAIKPITRGLKWIFQKCFIRSIFYLSRLHSFFWWSVCCVVFPANWPVCWPCLSCWVRFVFLIRCLRRLPPNSGLHFPRQRFSLWCSWFWFWCQWFFFFWCTCFSGRCSRSGWVWCFIGLPEGLLVCCVADCSRFVWWRH